MFIEFPLKHGVILVAKSIVELPQLNCSDKTKWVKLKISQNWLSQLDKIYNEKYQQLKIKSMTSDGDNQLAMYWLSALTCEPVDLEKTYLYLQSTQFHFN